ncbi:DUF885 domain-containing protein [Nonomuraea sp. NPDC049129]|uniref:DUF885 domain-containing protein n=1 Tax=Nonomuraea sp. NPDC049129 TaxID=3155272 RepID=UPI0034017DF6
MTRTPGDPDAARVAKAAEDYWQLLAAHEPEIRSRAGLPVERLPTRSHAEVTNRAARLRQIVEQVADLDRAQLSGADADTLNSLVFLTDSASGEADHFWLTPAATPYQTYELSRYRSTVFAAHHFASAFDVTRYLDLAAQYARRFHALAATLHGQRTRGILIARPALGSAISTIKALRESAAETLNVNGARLTELDIAAVGRLTGGIAHLLDREVVPAIERVLAIIDSADYADRAPAGVGLSIYPGGEEAYRFMVRRDTSLDISPEELHRLGLEQCQQLGERMSHIRSVLGFNVDEPEFRNILKAQSHLYASSPAEIEERYSSYMSQVEPLIGDYFSVLPSARYGVTRMEESLESGLTFGYYELPTPTQQLGRYRYNAANPAESSLLSAAALIYHELVPGHHLQLARQLENTELPPFRRYPLDFTAFIEGWAEYASGLGWEMGLYENPWDAYGRLSNERFTAARLALDTALNCGWWTEEEALAFMRRNMSESETQLRSELLRYATDRPAQALSYRTGFLAITRMRAEAESRAGDNFKIREFHDAILSAGALPLTALDSRLTRELWPFGR